MKKTSKEGSLHIEGVEGQTKERTKMQKGRLDMFEQSSSSLKSLPNRPKEILFPSEIYFQFFTLSTRRIFKGIDKTLCSYQRRFRPF